MWVRVRASHHGAFVLNNHVVSIDTGFLERISHLKYLDIFDGFLRPATLIYTDPLVNDTCDVFQRKSRKRHIMTWMKNNHVAKANHRLTCEQRMWHSAVNWMRRWNDGRIIIWKEVGVFIIPILLAVRTLVSRAKVTVWIVFRQSYRLRWFNLTVPWMLHAVRV